jgi:hypothetical protein
VEVVALVDDFLRAGAARSEAKSSRLPYAPSDVLSSSREIDRSTSEVIRARDATHEAVAYSRATTAGEMEARNTGQ